MTDKTEKKDEKKVEIEHKVGLQNYARVGDDQENFLITGAPTIRGKRWVNVSYKWGGPIQQFPEDIFLQKFWVPNPVEK